MTPLIDVMLVLVVIFMLTAPLLSSTIPLNLPKTAAAAPPAQGAPFVTLVVNPAGQLFLNDQPLALPALARQLTQVAQAAPDTEVHLRADATVPYGRVVEVMGVAQQAGLSRIGFVAESVPAGAPVVKP